MNGPWREDGGSELVRRPALGVALVLTAGISWGFLGLFVRFMNAAGLGALDVCAVRSIGAAVLLAAGLLASGRHRLLRIRRRDLWCFAGAGLGSITAFNCCYFSTLRHTSIGVAVILLYTSPVFVALMSRLFFKEPFTRWKTLALVLMLAGCVLISGVCTGGAENIELPWLFVGLGAGFCYALYSIFGRLAQERGYAPLTITVWAFLFAALGGLFIADWGNVASVVKAHPAVAFPWLGLVLVSTILSYSTYTASLRHLETSTAAVLVSVEPAVATLTGIVACGERLTLYGLAGMLLILAAAFALNRRG